MPFRKSFRLSDIRRLHLIALVGYIAEAGEPKLPPGMREHLYEDLNQSFDF